jgi:hypothetical protein
MRYLAIVFAALISGCAMDWSRPGASPEQMRQDYAACDISATGKYPESVVHITNTDPHEPSKNIDTNAILRDQETQYCMRQKGYACHLKCTR